MRRKNFGYKLMFDSTFYRFKEVEKKAETLTYLDQLSENGLSDATGYNPLKLPEYFREFYYVPPGERKYERNYPEINEIMRVIDYPYYFEGFEIDEVFNIKKDFRVNHDIELSITQGEENTLKSRDQDSVEKPLERNQVTL